MPGSLTYNSQKLVLNYIFRNSPSELGFVFLGLIAEGTISYYDTLETIAEREIEVTDENYSCQFINFSKPHAKENNNICMVKNNNEFQFGPWEEEQIDEITEAFICTAHTGTNGILLAQLDLTHPRKPSAGKVLDVLLGDLIFEIE